MKLGSLAIISAGFSPVPAVNGGAVEYLTTLLIEQNEYEHLFDIDLYTIVDCNFQKINAYKYTKIISFTSNKLEAFFEKSINTIARKLKLRTNFLFYRKRVARNFAKQNEQKHYDYLLIENSKEIAKLVSSKSALRNTKMFVHIHNDSSSYSQDPQLDFIIAKKATGIIAVSNYIKNSFLEKTKIDSNKISVLYNCAHSNDVIDNRKIVGLKKRLNLNSDDFIFLYIGRINYEKGTHILAEAFAQTRLKKAKLILCGGTWGNEFRNNKYLSEVKNKLSTNRNNVIFTGYINHEDIVTYYGISDVVIIPSVCQEAFGMVMLEASFMKKPCIATQSGGMMEILPSSDAFWVPIDNNIVQNMKNCIERSFYDSNERINIAERAYRQICSKSYFYAEGYLQRLSEIICSH